MGDFSEKQKRRLQKKFEQAMKYTRKQQKIDNLRAAGAADHEIKYATGNT